MTNKYRTLIADDEPPARSRLRMILSEIPEIELIGEACNGLEALDMIDRDKPDLLFLDIQMPGLTGFEVLQKVKHFPVVVFCTAYDDYALKAFETSAIDYIVKPITEKRIHKSVEKLKSLRPYQQQEQVLQWLEKFADQNQRKPITSIPIRTGDRVQFVPVNDISYFQAEDKYVTIVTCKGKRLLTDHPLCYLDEKLDDFLRIHRSLLINKAHIKEVNRHLSSRYVFRLDDLEQSRLISGRSYHEAIKLLFNLS